MPIQKSQLHRLMRIAALLKENRYPNSETLVKEFRRIAVEEDLEIDCGKKTILRDMKVLENEFNCPLTFDRARNGYCLKHHGWEFICPATLDENEMLAAVIGARIAEEIFPAPLKNKIRSAVDYLLQSNNPDFLDTANMASLTILSGLFSDLDPDIFMTVFRSWQQHKCVRISYADYRGDASERVIEPHTLVFYNNSWYTKGFCHRRNEPRTFALRRIRSAVMMPGDDFEPDTEIINSVNPDEFLNFEKICDVKLKVSPAAAFRLTANPLHSRQHIDADGIMTIPAVTREVLFPVLFSLRGQAVLIAPEKLRDELKKELSAMLDDY